MKTLDAVSLIVFVSVISSVIAHSPPPPCPSNYSEEAYYPDTDCTKFWQCNDGIAYLMPCPPDEHWDVIRLTCDEPAIARCTGQGWSTQSPGTTTTPVPISPITTTTTVGPVITTTSPVPVTTPAHITTTTSPVPVTTSTRSTTSPAPITLTKSTTTSTTTAAPRAYQLK